MNNQKYLNISLFIAQLIIIFLLVFKISSSLREFSDEIVSLSSNISFWFNGFDFSAGTSSQYYSYSPKLTSGPLSAIGSSIAWKFTENLVFLRVSNFLYVYLVQLIFCYFLSKIYKFSLLKLIMICSFAITSVPWWYGTLYSLGEMISSIIFFNSIFLYPFYRKTSIVMIAFSIFFGKFIFVIGFIGFYFSVLIFEKISRKIIKDCFYFCIPLLIWLMLVSLFYDSSVLVYMSDFYSSYFEQKEKFGSLDFSYRNVIDSFISSEVSTWNISVLLRVLLSPLILSFVLLKKNGFERQLKLHLFFAYFSIYLYFWILNPKKSVIYSQDFTYITLVIALICLIFNYSELDRLTKIGVILIVSFYMSSNILFVMFLLIILGLFLKKFKKELLSYVVIAFLVISQFNSLFESRKNENLDFQISECVENFNSVICNSNGYK
mgnify:FL=1|tara:strand:+ start:766 stop:2070 length:1305 start_codon:yes stop_codon:yes gene_type:complete